MESITKTDIILFVLSLLLIGSFIYFYIANDDLLVTETIASGLFSFSLIFKKHDAIKAQYLLLVLFIVLLFNVIDFSYTVNNGNTTTTYHSIKIYFLGINPIVFLILLLYLIVNRRLYSNLIQKLIYGSEEKKREYFNKEVSFYYEKFVKKSDEDLKNVFNLYKDYPKEAQVALTKIKEERALN